MQPHINLNYSIDAKIEDLTFGSMQEVVDTKFFPKNIESIAFRVTHYRADQYVDISINMSQRWYGATGSYNLSSSSEEGLLKIESHLKALFDSNLTVYKALLYPTASSVYLMPRILSFLVSVTVMYLGYVKFGEVALGGWLFIFWLVYMYSMELIKFAFPYYKFEIGYSNQYRSYLQKILIAIIVTVIVTTTYDFVKSLF